jgi:2-polyprenyl-3-methyl-5-hydroxy-6-metoxy-1,4-benzoquinol methylase
MVQCSTSDCGLQFLSPQPTEAELMALYRTTYYRPGTPNEENIYANTEDQVSRGLIHALAEENGPLAGRRLLDFGAGVGGLATIMRKMGAQATCIEPDEEARSYLAQRRLTHYPDLSALEAAAPNQKFDVITAIEVVEHLAFPVRDLDRLRRLLTPDGCLFLATPNFASLRARIQRLGWEQYRNPTHLFYYTPSSLAYTLKQAGFTQVKRLRTSIVYPQHGFLRRALQFQLRRVGLDGDLVVLARAPTAG